jgi:hypothetical protein
MDTIGYLLVLLTVLVAHVPNVRAQDVLVKSHINDSDPTPEVHVQYNELPEGFNDKTHGPGWNNDTKDPPHHPNHYYLVPPFIIGASVAIVLYIICNCFYLHCYAHRKIKNIAERHFSQPFIIAGDETSSGAYQAFTPVAYDEGDETGQFLFYQPINENEWEIAVDESSSGQGSVRSKSSLRGLRKKALASRIFGKKANPTSTSSAPEEVTTGRAIKLVPFNRSMSAPAKPGAGTRVVYAPVVIPRIQSMKNTRGTSVRSTSSDGTGTMPPQTPILVFGKGDAKGKVLFRNRAEDVVEDVDEDVATPEGNPVGTKPEKEGENADETIVTFHLPDGASDESKSPLADKENV